MSAPAWTPGAIHGVVVRPLARHSDERGWLSELFRDDELDAAWRPRMSYVSVTRPGISRGPHEHLDQTDMFGFVGPGTFLLRLWDHREDSPTRGTRQDTVVGEDNPVVVIVPPRVVHGYRNIGRADGWVLNFPNRLFKGPGKTQPVDEVRHENDPGSPFAMDDDA